MKDFLLTLFHVAFCALLFTGCMTEKKFIRFGYEHPDISSGFCADRFPVRQTVAPGRVDTVVKENTRVDTVTVVRTNEKTGKTEVVKVPCPPCNSKTEIRTRVDTVYQSGANEKNLEIKLKSAETKVIRYETKISTLQRNLYIAAGLVLVCLALMFIRK